MYRKFSADNIFNGFEILHGQVLITDAVGKIIDLVAEKKAGDGVEKLKGMLCPGFINCHCHLELSHMKGLVLKNTGLTEFVLKVVNDRHLAYRQAGFDEDQILEAVEKAEDEMIQNGIVAVGDICNNIISIPQKSKKRLPYHNFIEASGFPPSLAQNRFNKAVAIFDLYAASLPANSIVPHAPYSVSPQLFGLINDFEGNDILTIHNQESRSENEFFEKGTGKLLGMYEKMGIDISFYKPPGLSSLQTWFPRFTKGQTVIAVHNTFTSEQDIEFSKMQTKNPKLKTFFCLCPGANLYISNVLPDVNMLIQQGCEMVLGTDSLASNDQLNILEEIKILHHNFSELNITALLQWATSNGSRALGMDETLGSFEKGKTPGVVLIEGMEGMRITDQSKVRRVI